MDSSNSQRGTAEFILSVMVWLVCLAGPIALLVFGHWTFATISAAVAVSAYFVSLRWIKVGYGPMAGCMPLLLIVANTCVLYLGYLSIFFSAEEHRILGSIVALPLAIASTIAIVALTNLTSNVLIGQNESGETKQREDIDK